MGIIFKVKREGMTSSTMIIKELQKKEQLSPFTCRLSTPCSQCGRCRPQHTYLAGRGRSGSHDDHLLARLLCTDAGRRGLVDHHCPRSYAA